MGSNEEEMNTEYAYASGKIKVLEKRFFNKQELAGLLERSLTDIVGELESRGYPKIDQEKSVIENGEGLVFLEEMIDKHLDEAYNLVRELSLNPVITNAFLFLNDGHNLKGLIKLKYVKEKKKENIFLKRGFFTEEELKKMMERNIFSAFPPGLRELPQKAITAYKHHKNPQRIDFILDVGFWEYFKNQTGENEFVNEIGKIRVDLINLSVFFRLKEKKEKKTILKQSLLSGGTIVKDKFLRNFSKQINDFINDIRFSPYKKIVREGYDSWEKEHSFALLEKLGDDFLMNYIKKAKYEFLSIHPLIGYLLAKENEAKNLRILLCGKYSNLKEEIIKAELRETYV